MMERSQLIERLSSLRATIRRRLIAYGVCVVLTTVVAAFLTVVALDWLLWLPPFLRIALVGLCLVGFSGAAVRWIVRPAQARVGLDEIAARIEAHFGTLQDRLTSTVNFLRRRDAGSEVMIRRVVANTEQIIQDMSIESSLSLRPLISRGALLIVSMTLLSIILLVSPGWARTGFYRYVYPWGQIEWPRNTSILPLTGDLTAAVGESVTVRMAVQRGLRDTLRGVVHLREQDGDTMTLAMQRDQEEAGKFNATIDVVTKDLMYWFEAGDDSTGDTPYTIRVVRRPAVLEALITVEPPPYASHAPTRVRDLGDGPINAPIGGHVEVNVRASKAIPPDPIETGAGLRTETDAVIPLTVDAEDHHRLSTRFEVRENVRFRIELRDVDGFENRGGATYTVLATPDAPPNVAVLEPRSVTELTPTGSIPLLIRVEDDFGITRLTLEAEHIGGGGTHTFPLTEHMQTTHGERGSEAVARYVWSVESLSLSPGDLLIYRAEATDNHTAPGTVGQVGRSAAMRIKIISEVEFDIRLRSDLARLEARIRQASLDEADMLDRTTALLQQSDEPAPLTDAQREAASTAATRQAQLVSRLRVLAERFHRLTERMRRNQAGDAEAHERIAALGDTLQQIAAEPMTAASGALGRAQGQVEASAQQEALRDAARMEQIALDRLQALIRRMSQLGSFHELVAKTRGLLDRQSTLRRETAQLGAGMLGKPVASLTESEAAALKRTQRQQEQLAADIEQLLERMRQLAVTARSKDLSSVSAVDAALRAARANEVAKHMDTAVKAIEANRTAAATISQESAADAIRRMISALRERESRELEELRKRLERAEDQIKALIERQQTLRQATHEAGLIGTEEDSFNILTEQQRTLKRNATLLSEELAEREQTLVAVTPVRTAATHMREAETHLSDRQTEPATRAQDEALTSLNDALARLEELARQTEEEALLRSLDQIREDLEEILAAQQAVNTGIGKLKEAIAARGRIGRLEARSASKLARQQAGVRAMVETQIVDFQKVVVYEWALARVGKWMDESRNGLAARRINDGLVATTDRIVRELEKLISAIIETKALPVDTEFVEAAGGGGRGQGGMIQYKPVPTVAELLVLKAMQVDINERTEGLHQSLDIDNATEAQLRDLTMLGEDQAEVRRLTEKVTDRARLP